MRGTYGMKKTVILFLLLLITVSALQAESPDVKFLTMEEAIERALGVNNQLKSSFYAYKKSQWDYANAWTQLLPNASINSRYTWFDDSTYVLRDFFRQNIGLFFPGIPSDAIPQTVFQEMYSTSIDVEMTLFNSAIFNGIGVASALKKGAKDGYQSKRQQTVFEVVSGYLNMLRSRDLLAFQKEYLDLSEKNYQKAERMKDAGRYSRSEALRWKVDYQMQQSNLVSNQSTLRSMGILLKRLLNIDMKDSLKVEATIPKFLLDESSNVALMTNDALLSMIELTDAELIEVNAVLAAMKSGTETARRLYLNSYGSYLPNVSASFSHAWYENETLELDGYNPQVLSVNVSMPLFTSFRNLTSIKSAYYDYKEDQENLEDQLQNTRLILTETVNKLMNLKAQRALSKTNVELNENTYRIIESQQEKGLVSNLEFIDAKLNLQNARLNEINTEYDFITSVVELYFLIGKLESIVIFE